MATAGEQQNYINAIGCLSFMKYEQQQGHAGPFSVTWSLAIHGVGSWTALSSHDGPAGPHGTRGGAAAGRR